MKFSFQSQKNEKKNEKMKNEKKSERMGKNEKNFFSKKTKIESKTILAWLLLSLCWNVGIAECRNTGRVE